MLLNERKVVVISEFLRDYTAKYTGSAIAQKKNLNQKSVANTLQEFERFGVLTSKKEGKNKLYRLQSDDKETLFHFIIGIEHLRTIFFYNKNLLIKEIMTKLKPASRGILIIFGSYAKGIEKKESDIDLFIIGEYQREYFKKISDMYGKEINVKQYTHPHFKKALKKKDYLVKEVIKDHILIQGAEEMISLLMGIYYE